MYSLLGGFLKEKNKEKKTPNKSRGLIASAVTYLLFCRKVAVSQLRSTLLLMSAL